MARKKRRLSPEERAELDVRYEQTTRLLEERIAYHRAKLEEERERAAKRVARHGWRRLFPARG